MKSEKEVKTLLQRLDKILERINAIPNPDRSHFSSVEDM